MIVTSQEEIDKILGELRTATKNDFSKIQGRFQTRLSLSSANADEVIQKRLLEKGRDRGRGSQKHLYVEKRAISFATN